MGSAEEEGGEDRNDEGPFDKSSTASMPVPSSKSKRRTKQLSFTCKLCATRMTKLINPHAWTNGAIVIRCEGCGVKHQLVDNLGVFDLLNSNVKKNPPHLSN